MDRKIANSCMVTHNRKSKYHSFSPLVGGAAVVLRSCLAGLGVGGGSLGLRMSALSCFRSVTLSGEKQTVYPLFIYLLTYVSFTGVNFLLSH